MPRTTASSPLPPILDANDPAEIQRAAEILQAGGIVVIPTDTVYGIGAALDRPGALARIFASKGRPADRTLPVLLGGADDLSRVARTPPDRIARLMDRFWPGPLTIVLPANARLPPEVVAPDHTVGVRVPNHAVTRAVLGLCGGALAVTSANRSGMRAAVDAITAAAELWHDVDAVLDAGPATGGVASTVVRVTGDELEILRAGAIDPTPLRDVWGA